MKQTCDDHNLDDPYILRDKSLVGQLFTQAPMKPTLHCDIRITLYLKTGDDHNLDDPYILRDK